MKDIKISIIIPAFNTEKYTKRCVESAINQTLQEIEIIVVNDGSTDGTKDVIERLSLEDDRIIIINKKNGGWASSVNAGLDIAKGGYVQELDGDDWIEPNACEESYQFAIEENLDIVVCDYYRDDDNGKIRYVKGLQCKETFLSGEEYLKYFFSKKTSPVLWSKLIKKELYKGTRLPIDNWMGADVVTVFKLALKAKKIGKLEEAFTHWIKNPNSVTRREPSKFMYQTFETYDEIEKIIREGRKLDNYKKDLSLMRCLSFIAFFTQKPFYRDDNYQKTLNYMLSYLKQNNIPKNIQSSRYFLVKTLKKFPYKVVFYALNIIFYLSPF